MIISGGRRYIFVHIPKTGGTSLTLALEHRAMKDDILIADTPKGVKRRGRLKNLPSAGRLWKHSNLADIDQIVVPTELEEYFVVTMVRNPWDRLVSYYHWLTLQTFDHPSVSLAQSKSFQEFLRSEYIQASFSRASYASYVADRFGAEHCNSYVRLENLTEDLAEFEAHLGFSLSPIPHVNKSPRNPDYRSHYDQKTAEIVARVCADDINRFGYEF